ncbi:hypothetical protein BH23VER1_BH23VER1_29350 [soil metagenome]
MGPGARSGCPLFTHNDSTPDVLFERTRLGQPDEVRAGALAADAIDSPRYTHRILECWRKHRNIRWGKGGFPEGEMSSSPGLAGGTAAYPGLTPGRSATPTGLWPGSTGERRRGQKLLRVEPRRADQGKFQV